MIHGIGIDLIEIDRIKDVYIKQSDKLIHRILTEQEQQKFNSFKMIKEIRIFSRTIATKEAFSKALGTGLGKTVAFNDIDCYNDEKGNLASNILVLLFMSRLRIHNITQ